MKRIWLTLVAVPFLVVGACAEDTEVQDDGPAMEETVPPPPAESPMQGDTGMMGPDTGMMGPDTGGMGPDTMNL